MYNYTITRNLNIENEYSIVLESNFNKCFLLYNSSSENIDENEINKFIHENITGIRQNFYQKEINMDYTFLYDSLNTKDINFFDEFDNCIDKKILGN